MNARFADHRAREIAAAIESLFQSLFASGAASSVAPIPQVAVEVTAAAPADADRHLAALFPEERQHVQTAVPKRQAEFAAGRVGARRALARLGIPAAPLPANLDRTPRWPAGVVGSISHAEATCAVVVARASQLAGIGLDLESAAPLAPDLEGLIATPDELRRLDRAGTLERGRALKLLFSAKESFYKCQYTRTRTFLDFLDVELDLDRPTGTVSPRLVNPAHHALSHLQAARGRWQWRDDLVITTCALVAS
jgi:4'-phosphopantetheinyl transferase EntD